MVLLLLLFEVIWTDDESPLRLVLVACRHELGLALWYRLELVTAPEVCEWSCKFSV
jgi:hypothetical protein